MPFDIIADSNLASGYSESVCLQIQIDFGKIIEIKNLTVQLIEIKELFKQIKVKTNKTCD